VIPKTLRLRLLSGAAIILVVGLVTGWSMSDDEPDASKLVAPAERWQEPALRQADAAKAVASLARHSLWGDAGPAAGSKDAKVAGSADWRLSGIVDDNGPPMAVIMVSQSGKVPARVQYSKNGDELPDGSHIVEITKSSITVSGTDGQRQIKLFFQN
jgi:hypothetical protein